MNKVAYIAGCCLSFFSIASLVVGSVMLCDIPMPFDILMWIMILGALSGVICLVLAFFDLFKNKKQISN